MQTIEQSFESFESDAEELVIAEDHLKAKGSHELPDAFRSSPTQSPFCETSIAYISNISTFDKSVVFVLIV